METSIVQLRPNISYVVNQKLKHPAILRKDRERTPGFQLLSPRNNQVRRAGQVQSRAVGGNQGDKGYGIRYKGIRCSLLIPHSIFNLAFFTYFCPT